MGIINDDVVLAVERGVGGRVEASINERMKSFMAMKFMLFVPESIPSAAS